MKFIQYHYDIELDFRIFFFFYFKQFVLNTSNSKRYRDKSCFKFTLRMTGTSITTRTTNLVQRALERCRSSIQGYLRN